METFRRLFGRGLAGRDLAGRKLDGSSNVPGSGRKPPVSGGPSSGILLESGDFLLMETGEFLLQET